jgi:hypothetical protein
MATKALGGGEWEVLFNGYRVQFETEVVLELDGSNGYMIMLMVFSTT